MSREQALAWSAHLFTSLGLVAAAGIAVLIVWNNAGAFRTAFALMFVATLIDALDGSIARMLHVKEVLPEFDGRRLDDIIDFQTYTSLPLLLVWRAGILPASWSVLLLLPLLASAFGFSRIGAKTEDGYFLGFPSYWNVVAFYLYFLAPPPWFSIAVIVILSLLTFIPSRYLYPTQPGPLNRATNVLGAIWAVILVLILATAPQPRRTLILVSLFFPVYYMTASWCVSIRRGL